MKTWLWVYLEIEISKGTPITYETILFNSQKPQEYERGNNSFSTGI